MDLGREEVGEANAVSTTTGGDDDDDDDDAAMDMDFGRGGGGGVSSGGGDNIGVVAAVVDGGLSLSKKNGIDGVRSGGRVMDACAALTSSMNSSFFGASHSKSVGAAKEGEEEEAAVPEADAAAASAS